MKCGGKFNIYNLFVLDNDTLVKIHMSSCQYFRNIADEQFYICLEYNGHLAIISKDNEPSWFDLSPVGGDGHLYRWRRRIINLSEQVISATCYNGTVYMLSKLYVFIQTIKHINFTFFLLYCCSP